MPQISVEKNRVLRVIEVLDKAREANYPIWRAAFDQIVKAEQVLNAAAMAKEMRAVQADPITKG